MDTDWQCHKSLRVPFHCCFHELVWLTVWLFDCLTCEIGTSSFEHLESNRIVSTGVQPGFNRIKDHDPDTGYGYLGTKPMYWYQTVLYYNMQLACISVISLVDSWQYYMYYCTHSPPNYNSISWLNNGSMEIKVLVLVLPGIELFLTARLQYFVLLEI